MAIAAACLTSAAAFAQSAVLLGTEFQVNAYTEGFQGRKGVAIEANGDFVAVWTGDTVNGVFGQRYASTGAKLGAAFQVNTFPVSNPNFNSTVSSDADGDFVVVWDSNYIPIDGSGYWVAAQRFNSAGDRLAFEFRVNTYVTGDQQRPTVARETNGDFIIAWQSVGQDGDASGIFARRFASDGVALTNDFRVNTHTPSSQFAPAIDLDDDGDFVIVWESSSQDVFSTGIFGQRFDSLGAPQGPEFRANHVEAGAQHGPDVALDADGDFTVVWHGPGTMYGSAVEIFARRFASNGVTPGLDLTINESWSGDQQYPSIAMDADGSFIVAWDAGDGNQNGIFARHFSPSGFPTTGDFRVNTYVTNNQFRSVMSAGADGDFVAVWLSGGQDGHNYGVFGKRVRVPALIDVDGDGEIAPLGDGILILRHSFGFTGTTLTTGAVGPSCTRCDSATIVPYLESLR